MEDAALLRERAIMVEEAASKAREEALSHKNAVADLDREKASSRLISPPLEKPFKG